MKKTLSIIMALCMLLTVCLLPTAAAEETVGKVAAGYKPAETATPITDAAGFAAMTADGSYYLANDITIDATWNAGAELSETYTANAAFTGTLDGNGKTITTTAPLFANLQGTVKNLTVEGKIADSKLHSANISLWTVGTVVIDNVYTKADIAAGNTSGGFIGYAATGANITITNSRNDANITCSGQGGGFVGYIQDYVITVENCTNYGNITSANYCGGIVGRLGRDKASAPKTIGTFTGCANYGRVESAKGQSAGILAYLVGDAVITGCVNYGEIVNKALISGGIFGAHGNYKDTCGLTIDGCINYGKIVAPGIAGGIGGRVGRQAPYGDRSYFITNCENYGEIVVTPFEGYADIICVGGIAGYMYGGSANGCKSSVNAGSITVDSTNGTNPDKDYCVGGILGYVNSRTFDCQFNVNSGSIKTTGTFDTVCLTVYNRNTEAEAVKNNYAVGVEGIAVACTGTASADPSTLTEATAFATAVSAEQLASGEVAFLINEAAGSTVYYQTIGTDKTPVHAPAEDGSNTVLKKADGSYGNPEKAPDTTEPAPDTTEPSSSGKTGDSFVIFALIAAVSVLGVALVAKKREN